MIRLLDISTHQLKEFDENDTPAYAIASHRWQKDEAVFKDVLKGRNHDTVGFAKIRGFCDWIRSWQGSIYPNYNVIRWLWIDTCCIDKRSSAELSEAINSMYNWYAEAEVCIAYLFDIQVHHEFTAFEASEWFDRGWTLQELVAPATVLFLDKDWQTIGHKKGPEQDSDDLPLGLLGRQLNDRIARRTGIPRGVLRNPAEIDSLSVETRLSWMEKRQTTKVEDEAYCLLGVFNIYIPLIYGEREQASRRLLDEILRRHVWMARGVENNSDTVNNDLTSENMDRAQTSQNVLLRNMRVLQDRISRLEMEHDNIHRTQTARRRAKRTARRFSTMLDLYQWDLQEQAFYENMAMQKAQAFWNPLEQYAKRTGSKS